MGAWVALLRAVNVGGTGKLAMKDLAALVSALGCGEVRTYIQSGNVVFTSRRREKALREALEGALAEAMGKPVGVLLRPGPELRRIADASPYVGAPPNRVLVYFLERPLPRGALDSVEVPGREEIHPEGREVYVHYPDGQGRSKLKLPFAREATARNLNTIRRLAEMVEAVDGGR